MGNFDPLHFIDNSLKLSSCSIVDNADKLRTLMTTPSTYKIFCMNIRSIRCNYDDFLILQSRINVDFEIYCFTECWLTENCNLLNMPGYNFYRSMRNYNQNDGVVMYCKDDLAIDCSESTDILDCTNLIVKDKDQNMVVILVYRSPSYKDPKKFISSLLDFLRTTSGAKTTVVTGDLNLDILDDQNENAQNYIDGLAELGFVSALDYPTRKKTLLDHYFVRSTATLNAYVLHSIVTDHWPIILDIQLKQPKSTWQNNNKKIVKWNAVITDIKHVDWDPMYSVNDVNVATNMFTSKIADIIKINTCRYGNQKSKDMSYKPWISDNLLACARKRDAMHLELRKNPSDLTLNNIYKRYRNTCKEATRIAKALYYKNRINESLNNPRKCWQLLNEYAGGPLPAEDKNITKLLTKLNRTCFSEGLQKINVYFQNIGNDLAQKLLKRTNTTLENLSTSIRIEDDQRLFCNSFFFLPTDHKEIDKIISGLKSNSSPGEDKLTGKIVKDCRRALIAPITFICNLSMSSGVFPTPLKRAIIVPIFKAGNDDELTNYRPISLLSVVSKVLEKVVKNRLTAYLNKHEILSDRQYGFRQHMNTEDALVKAINVISGKLDQGHKCIGVFLDLSKAFDTVSTNILLTELELIGIRGVALDWFGSYLLGRSQKVVLNKLDLESSSLEMECGVPQGSVLGPILFIIYVNKLLRMNLKNCDPVAFADDTLLLFYGDNWIDTFKYCQDGLDNTLKWMDSRVLTVNKSKTKYISFSINASSQPPKNLQVIAHQVGACRLVGRDSLCQCPVLERVTSIKYLGVIVDQHLNWKEQVLKVRQRLRSLSHYFWQVRNIVQGNLLWSVYFAMAHCVLSYGILAWGGAAKSILSVAQPAQNNILKIITRKPSTYDTEALYSETGILNIRQTYACKVALYYVQNEHLHRKRTTEHSVRRKHFGRIMLEKGRRTIFGTRFISWIGPRIYNNLPVEARGAVPDYKRKKLIKSWLVELGFLKLEDLVFTMMG